LRRPSAPGGRVGAGDTVLSRRMRNLDSSRHSGVIALFRIWDQILRTNRHRREAIRQYQLISYPIIRQCQCATGREGRPRSALPAESASVGICASTLLSAERLRDEPEATRPSSWPACPSSTRVARSQFGRCAVEERGPRSGPDQRQSAPSALPTAVPPRPCDRTKHHPGGSVASGARPGHLTTISASSRRPCSSSTETT
jgi:hypothetical protein